MANGRRSRVKTFIFSIIPVVFFLLSGEISLRLARLPREKYVTQRFAFPPEDEIGKAFLRDPALAWRLNPGYDGPWTMLKLAYSHEEGQVTKAAQKKRRETYPDRAYHQSVTWQINKQGRRGIERPEKKRKILFIGSSVTFGWAVRAEDSFSGVIASLLQRHGYPDWGIVNAGVPGYSTFQMRRYLPALLHEVKPEIVIVEAGLNDGVWAPAGPDCEVIQSAKEKQTGLISRLIQSSNFCVWLRGFLRAEHTFRERQQNGGKAFYASMLHVPGHSRVSPDEFSRNLAEMKKMSEGAGARFYCFFPCLFNEYGQGKAQKSVQFTDPTEIAVSPFLASLSTQELKRYFLPYDEGHPSRFGHQYLAAKIWQRLLQDKDLVRTNPDAAPPVAP